MKRIFNVLFFVFAFMIFSGNVGANNISRISMDIYIDKNGDAYITETWNAYLNEGTEGYRYYGNLGNSEILDYSVRDSNNQYTSFNSYGSWDIDASFSEKAYKYGIYDAGDHKELCFGISRYGSNTYTLKYKITGFVATTEDSDIIYWELIPSNLDVDSAYIKIHSDFDYADTLIPYVQYMNNDTAFAVGDDRVVFFAGSQVPERLAMHLYDTEIRGVYYSEDYVGIVSYNDASESRYLFSVYDTSGTLVTTKEFDMDYADIVFDKDTYIIYNEEECIITTIKGVEKYNGMFKQQIRLLVTTGGKYRYTLVTDDSIDIIMMK